MSNQEILDQLINGKDNTEQFEFEGLSGPLTLRPLTTGEILELQKLEKKDQRYNISVEKDGKTSRKGFRDKTRKEVQKLQNEVDAEQLRENIARTKFRAISLSADIPEKTVEKLPGYLPDLIFEKVVEISKLTEKDLDLIADFRKDE